MTGLIDHAGSCHCGAVQVVLRATRPVAELPLRRCDCSFCRRHNARTVAYPAGELEIRAAHGALRKYRFGLGITDILTCATCGVYIEAEIEELFAPMEERLDATYAWAKAEGHLE